MNKLSDRLKDMPFMKRAINADSTLTKDDNNNNWFIDTGIGDVCDEIISKNNNSNNKNNDKKTKKRCQEVVDSILHNSRIRMKKKEKKEPQQEENTKKSKQSKEQKKHKHTK